jgi:hypothetical protein
MQNLNAVTAHRNFHDSIGVYAIETPWGKRRMRIGLLAVFLSCVLSVPPGAFGQAGANPRNQPSTDNCWQAGAVELSAAQTKARLRHVNPISPPLLYRGMRFTNAVLSFKLGTDIDGNVICIRMISGHPIIIGAAIESIKTWKFRPPKVKGQLQAIFGTLVVSVSGTEHGLKTKVLNAEPQKDR